MVKNIYRIDTRYTHGWQFRKNYRGRQYSKFFSDSLLGGSEKAYAAAVAHRDTQIKRMVPYRFRNRKQKNNTTGRTGISCTYEKRRRGIIKVLQVHWVDKEGKRHNKKFYVHRYSSERQALAAATDFRLARENDAILDRLRNSEFLK